MRSITLALFSGLFFCSTLQAQTDTLADVQMAPLFPGGEQALLDFLKNNFQTPVVKAAVRGRVVATFVIEKDGSVGEVAILQPLHPAVDTEMLRLVRSMPAWRPGQANGHPVRVRYTLPMTVQIPGQKRARAIDFDWFLALGGGFWTGALQDRYTSPDFLYNAGISFPFKTWRLGVDITAVNTTARENLTFGDAAIARGQELVLGWMSLEAQRPRAWSDRLVFAPLLSAGLGFQNRLGESVNGQSGGPYTWGAHLRAGAQLDWIFARHPYDNRRWEPFTLGHALRFRAGFGPAWFRHGGDPGLLFFGSIGYSLQSRRMPE